LALPQIETILQKLRMAPGVAPPKLKPRYPAVAISVVPGKVGAVRLGNAASRPSVAAHSEAILPPGTIAPSLTRGNLVETAPVQQAIREVLLQVAPREDRVSLVLPDSVARVSILKFNRMPATRREVLELIRFRMQKVLPFKIEEAALDYQLLSDSAASEPDFLVTLAQRPVLFQYERLLGGLERHAGLVDLESFNLVNLIARFPERTSLDQGDWAMVNAAPGYLTVLFFRQGGLCFYRCKAMADEERAGDAHGVSVRRELASCAAFYREHLDGKALHSAYLKSSNGDGKILPGLVHEELGCAVQVVDPGKAVTLPPGSDPGDPKWQSLAAAIGAALGRRP
jgi:type IV pilus assembly protein PilM